MLMSPILPDFTVLSAEEGFPPGAAGSCVDRKQWWEMGCSGGQDRDLRECSGPCFTADGILYFCKSYCSLYLYYKCSIEINNKNLSRLIPSYDDCTMSTVILYISNVKQAYHSLPCQIICFVKVNFWGLWNSEFSCLACMLLFKNW